MRRRKRAQRYATDFVLSAPKSLSLVWAFGTPQTRDIVETAMYEAAKSAVDVLLREATYERVGKQGARLVPARGIAALFFHIASRHAEHDTDEIFPDPNIHVHAVVSEVVAGENDIEKVAYKTVWGRWVMALGAWFHAGLAGRLFAAGFDIIPTGGNGSFVIGGVPVEACKAFSARTFGEKGLNGKAPQRIVPVDGPAPVAEVKKRGRPARNAPPAPMQVTAEALQAVWRAFALDMAALVAGVEAKADASRETRPMPFPLTAAALARTALRLAAGVEKLTEAKSVLQKQDLVRLKPSRSYAFEQWTTKAAYRREIECRQFLAELLEPSPRHRIALEEADFRDLNEGQRTALALAASDRRIVLVEGGAGTGKTFCLVPLVAAHKRTGRNPQTIACAEAWKTAVSLSDRFELGDRGYALAKFFALLEAPESAGGVRLDERTLLIVDEVGLVSIARMHAILKAAFRFKVKLVLVGDEAQLEPIGAGSGVRLLKSAGGLPATRLTENMRAKSPAQRQAVEKFRERDFAGFYRIMAAENCGFRSRLPVATPSRTGARTGRPGRTTGSSANSWPISATIPPGTELDLVGIAAAVCSRRRNTSSPP